MFAISICKWRLTTNQTCSSNTLNEVSITFFKKKVFLNKENYILQFNFRNLNSKNIQKACDHAHTKDSAMHITYDGPEFPGGVLSFCTDQDPRVQCDSWEKVTEYSLLSASEVTESWIPTLCPST